MRQILVNLVGNAIKFSHRGQISVAAMEERDKLIFQVRDEGIGISPAHLVHVFDPFWQADQSPSRRTQGTGLGLSVSRHLARLLGDDLTAESSEGQGSVFTCWLPFVSAPGGITQ